jgi:oligopeptidase B
MKFKLFALSLCTVILFSCSEKNNEPPMMEYKTSQILENKDLVPPQAEIQPTSLIEHGDERIDNYYWMKLTDEQKMAEEPDEQTQKVVDYLNAENDYLNKMMAHTDSLQKALYDEIVGRIKQTDESVPYFYNGYWYSNRFEEGKEYAINTRRKGSLDAEEEILIDQNKRAEGKDYYSMSRINISPDNKIAAFGEDYISRRQYNIRFKNLETGELYPDVIENTTGGVTWAKDNKTVFYSRKDAALRSYKIFKHKLGTPVDQDQEVYHEEDETFSTYVYNTKSRDYIIIGSYATVSQEYRVLDASDPDGTFKVFQPRERDLEYNISHYNDKWYIRTNKDGAKNFKIMTCPLDKTGKEHWVDFIPHRDDVLVEGLDLFKDFMVVSERIKGITQIRVKPWEGNDDHYIDFGEDAFLAYTSMNPEFDTDKLRVGFTSLTTPNSTYDYDVKNHKLELKKQQEVVGDFKPEDYQSERIFAKAEDGTEIPISIVYKKGFKKDGTRPLLLYGYGSYGNSMDPYFSSVRLSLLDRGFAFALAHIRGGEEMGRYWYEEGKLLNKKNTFTDFIACADHLVKIKYTTPKKLFAMGGSAGGLLMGAVVNMRPDLWQGVIAAVPFVDVVTTMLDESIPLTTGEFDEWGNPKDEKYYNYIKEYSPYDNVVEKDYPPMLVTTGYHDSQVQYWEPAKWVAKLRELKTDDNPLLLYCNMDTGHGGASGRFARYKETAMEYAFLLDLAGVE